MHSLNFLIVIILMKVVIVAINQ